MCFPQVWVWLEARQLASAALVNIDDLVKYDLYVRISRGGEAVLTPLQDWFQASNSRHSA